MIRVSRTKHRQRRNISYKHERMETVRCHLQVSSGGAADRTHGGGGCQEETQ